MRLDEIIQEPGTYVSVKFTQETNENLRDFALELGLDPIEDFHMTVVYSPKPLNIDFGKKKFNGFAKITGMEYLGELDSDHRAIVLNVHSNEVQELYNYYVEKHGYVHTYDEFIQHISLAYKPPEDLDLSSIELPDFEIQFDHIEVEALKE